MTDNPAAALLKQATAQKKQGNLDAAIALIRRAWREMDHSDMVYPGQRYLKLPLYIQSAGRPGEAWSVINEIMDRLGRRMLQGKTPEEPFVIRTARLRSTRRRGARCEADGKSALNVMKTLGSGRN